MKADESTKKKKQIYLKKLIRVTKHKIQIQIKDFYVNF